MGGNPGCWPANRVVWSDMRFIARSTQQYRCRIEATVPKYPFSIQTWLIRKSLRFTDKVSTRAFHAARKGRVTRAGNLK
jgi:hypothetical protein